MQSSRAGALDSDNLELPSVLPPCSAISFLANKRLTKSTDFVSLANLLFATGRYGRRHERSCKRSHLQSKPLAFAVFVHSPPTCTTEAPSIESIVPYLIPFVNLVGESQDREPIESLTTDSGTCGLWCSLRSLRILSRSVGDF